MRRLSLLFLFVLLLASCGRPSSGYDVKVALDPVWSNLAIPGRENNMTAFFLELLTAIGKEENFTIAIYEKSWDNLMLGLQKNEYEAICSSLQPYLFYEKTYVFSDIFLPTGLVLVTRTDSSWHSLEALKGRDVAVLQPSIPILEKYPKIIQHTYPSPQQAFQALKEGLVDAALIDRLSAQAFINDLYAGQLKIASHPLTEDGVRMMGLKPQADRLIQKLNSGLAALKTNGTYQKIAQKWGLSEPSPS